MSPGTRPADPTATAAPPPGDLDPGWAEALAGVLADPTRHRLAFQPVVDLQRGTVVGYETLSRFAGPPDAGPDAWFEAASRLGLGAELDGRVLERVVRLRPRRWPPGPWPARPPTASTRWSASTTGATTWTCSASSSSCTGS